MAKKMKRSKTYWQTRFVEVEKQVISQAMDFTQETLVNYARTLTQIEKEINYWYTRIAANNNVSLEEAKKLLSKGELKEFKWTVEDYIKAGQRHGADPRWMKQLENASAKAHITRLDAMKIQMGQQVEVLAGKQNIALKSHLQDLYSDTVNRSLFEIQKGVGVGSTFAKFDQAHLDKVTQKPWTLDGSTFSDRIWTHKQKLIDKLNTGLTQSIAMGEDPSAAIEDIAKTFNRSRYEAARLVMTESAAFASMADQESYKQMDVEKYEIIATLDGSTSDICQDLDGKIFDLEDFQIGVTAPPFHPNCRTTTGPYDEDMDDIFGPGERAARDPETGKTVMIPGDMTYEEWKAKEGKIELKKGFNTTDDPIREVMGSMFESNPDETKKIIDELKQMGVEVDFRDSSAMAYSPDPRKGNPGKVIIDKNASYGALMHEYTHAKDDRDLGWPGMKFLYNQDIMWKMEENAYRVEMEIYKDYNVSEEMIGRLKNLKNERRKEIYGERNG